MAEGGRVALDLKALRAAAKANGPPGWGLLAKGQTNLELVEARVLIRDGVLLTEMVQARSGTAGVAASGRVDLAERTLDLQLFHEIQRPDRPAAQASRHGGRRERDDARPLARAVRARSGSWPDPAVGRRAFVVLRTAGNAAQTPASDLPLRSLPSAPRDGRARSRVMRHS